ncbi:hypothetical protein AVEN_90783-1, partial [Araneus ventricosus]
MIHLQNICFEIEKFCDVKLTSSEHVDTRPSRIARYNEDAAKLSQWLSEHNPFPKIDVIMSIDSGIVGGNEVNCHLSEEIGRDMISKMMGKKFENVKFKRKGKVVTLASINISVKICNISIVVDPHILFHRLCIAKQSDDDLKEFFKFELSPFPILLFTGESMRKGTKSSLYTSFSPITEDVKPEGSHGCYITPALFGQGKNKFINLFLKHEELLNRAATFLNPQATTEQVTEAGENVLVALYGGDPATQNLDALRYHSFVKAAAKTKFNLARLPPTTDAGQLHAMRSYHQVQTWLGNEKDPLKWGWMHTPSGLFPKKSEKDPAPESLLQCISCTCKKVCTNACRCRKAGLHCSLLCKHCIGQSCENPIPVIIDNESEKGEAPAPIDMIDEQLECEDIE